MSGGVGVGSTTVLGTSVVTPQFFHLLRVFPVSGGPAEGAPPVLLREAPDRSNKKQTRSFFETRLVRRAEDYRRRHEVPSVVPCLFGR